MLPLPSNVGRTAVNRQWKNRDGEVQDQADFIPVVVWGSQAENCEIPPQEALSVEGRIQVRSYEATTGERRWVTEVVAQGVTFLGSRRDSGEAYPSDGDQVSPSRGGSLREKGFDDDFVRDISELDDVKDEGEDADIPF